jgi:hypothetical protein
MDERILSSHKSSENSINRFRKVKASLLFVLKKKVDHLRLVILALSPYDSEGISASYSIVGVENLYLLKQIRLPRRWVRHGSLTCFT